MDIVTEQLRLMADAFADEVAFKDVTSGSGLTFGVWEARSNQLARGLVEGLGLAKGDRVALYLPPDRAVDWVVGYVAIHKAGGVAVPVNTRLAAAEVRALLDHAEAGIVLADDDSLPSPAADRIVVTDLAAAMADDSSAYQAHVEPDDLADIVYTSGTTGRPKGVAVSHANIGMLPTVPPTWTGPGWLSSSPLFTFAGSNQVYTAMKLGLVALHQPRFSVDGWIDAVESERPTMTFLVPAMVELLLTDPRIAAADLSSLGLVAVGSAPLPAPTLQRLRARLPDATVTNNYNLTEAGTAYFSMPPDQASQRVGSIGRAVPPTQVRIVSDADADVAAGEVGELWLQVPGRMRHYYKEPEATGDTWHDGWLRSGDLARVDSDGFVYIVGRKKDVIIRGGNNIYAADVEAVLFEHPDVQQAAVAAVPHPVLGEDVGAWIVLRPGASPTTTTGALLAHCAARLADYKVPRSITLLDDLPRNAMGKVVKGDLPRRGDSSRIAKAEVIPIGPRQL